MQQLRIKVWVYDHTVFKTKEDAKAYVRQWCSDTEAVCQYGNIVSQIIKVDDYEVV